MPGFEFFVTGIEDGIIELLSTLSVKAEDPGYLKSISTYGGELDQDALKKYVDQLVPRFPLALVSYGDGEDEMAPATSPVFGEPRIFRHKCDFTVICCSDDARGEKAQRRGSAPQGRPGVYQMVSDVRDLLAGRQFRRADVDGHQVLLTLEPLKVSGVEYLARLPQLTAYAAHLATYFKYVEPDRRSDGIAVDELIFDVTPIGGASEPGGKPGVILQ